VNKLKIETSISLEMRDEEVEIYGKPNCGILGEGESGLPVAEVCRKHGISNATYYQWKSKYSGVSASELNASRILKLRTASSSEYMPSWR
jgi:UDP-N-acetylmuramoylalanine-D-glutamate ligase